MRCVTAVHGVASFALALALSACVASTQTPAPTPTVPPTTAPSTTTPPVATATAAATAPAYVNATYKFSVVLPAPYRKSTRLSFVKPAGQQPAAEDAFTARTDADEAAIGTDGCHTACPTWNYTAYVSVNTGTGSRTLREFYATEEGGTATQTIEDTTVDGRAAIRVTNGARYPMQFIVTDGDRIVVVAYQLYPTSTGISVPAGATKEKLDAILTSFRFTP